MTLDTSTPVCVHLCVLSFRCQAPVNSNFASRCISRFDSDPIHHRVYVPAARCLIRRSPCVAAATTAAAATAAAADVVAHNAAIVLLASRTPWRHEMTLDFVFVAVNGVIYQKRCKATAGRSVEQRQFCLWACISSEAVATNRQRWHQQWGHRRQPPLCRHKNLMWYRCSADTQIFPSGHSWYCKGKKNFSS